MNNSVNIAEVHPFGPEHKVLKVPIVDSVMQYDDPYSGGTYILISKELLYVTEMKYNLTPPFLMKDDSLVACHLSIVQSQHHTKHHHSM